MNRDKSVSFMVTSLFRLQALEQPLDPHGERLGYRGLADLSQPCFQFPLKLHSCRTRGAACEVLLQLSSLHDPYLVIQVTEQMFECFLTAHSP
jgi:hypothetical protein